MSTGIGCALLSVEPGGANFENAVSLPLLVLVLENAVSLPLLVLVLTVVVSPPLGFFELCSDSLAV